MLLCALAFQVRHHSQTLQFFAELHFDHQTRSLVTVPLQSNVELHFDLSFTAVLKWWLAGGGKVSEIYDRCFSRQMCNCGQLRATLCIFVGVKRELGTPVLHVSLIAPLRHCSLSLKHVTCPELYHQWLLGGTNFSPQRWTHTALSVAVWVTWHVDAHKYYLAHMDARQG